MKYTKKAIVFLLLAALLLAAVPLSDAARRHFAIRKVAPAVYAAAADFAVPPAMILSVIRAESDFDADAVSAAGAVGYMQLLPETFDYLAPACPGLSQGAAVTDPFANIRCGAYYLSKLYQTFGDWQTTLAAYNAGEGRVRAWLCDTTLAENGRLRVIPFKETERYVAKVFRFYNRYKTKFSEQRSSL